MTAASNLSPQRWKPRAIQRSGELLASLFQPRHPDPGSRAARAMTELTRSADKIALDHMALMLPIQLIAMPAICILGSSMRGDLALGSRSFRPCNAKSTPDTLLCGWQWHGNDEPGLAIFRNRAGARRIACSGGDALWHQLQYGPQLRAGD